MRTFTLVLAFASGALASLTQLFYSWGLPETVPHADRLFYIPALFFGTASWLRVRSFARTLPVLACLVLSLAGVMVVDETERGRAMLVFAGLAAAIPIASLVVELRAAQLCAKVFIAASVLNTVLLIVASGGLGGDGRFGYLVIDDMKVSNPNGFAAQMGLAAVLTTSLMRQQTNGNRKLRPSDLSISNRETQLMMLLGFFVLGILVSASRGAIITLSGMIVLLVCSKTTRALHRLAFCLALFLVTLVVLGTDNEIVSRFRATEEVVAFGDRLPIWQEAFEVLQSDGNYFWYGVGTGGAEKALAESSSFDRSTRRGEDGIFRKATHNTYVEWCLTHGLVGVLLAVWLALAATRRAVRFDRFDQSSDRRLLLAYCAIISMVTALYRTAYVTPLCALCLAMLSGPYLARWPMAVRSGVKQGLRRGRSTESQLIRRPPDKRGVPVHTQAA